MKQVVSRNDLDEMRSLPRALVFISVNWAMQARRSDVFCRQFLSELRCAYPSEDISLYHVDLSDQNGEVWIEVRKWLKDEGQPFDSLTYGGCGAMLWVRFGTVAGCVQYLAEIELHKLMAMTREFFELRPCT